MSGKVANHYYVPARYILVLPYPGRRGMTQNSYITSERFLKAVENGIAEAQYQIGYDISETLKFRVAQKTHQWLTKQPDNK